MEDGKDPGCGLLELLAIPALSALPPALMDSSLSLVSWERCKHSLPVSLDILYLLIFITKLLFCIICLLAVKINTYSGQETYLNLQWSSVIDFEHTGCCYIAPSGQLSPWLFLPLYPSDMSTERRLFEFFYIYILLNTTWNWHPPFTTLLHFLLFNI